MTEDEWEEWSNDLANILPEDAETWPGVNPEGAQESIIQASLEYLVAEKERSDKLREGLEALADRWASESSKMAVGMVKRGCAIKARELLSPVESECKEHGWECANTHAILAPSPAERYSGSSKVAATFHPADPDNAV